MVGWRSFANAITFDSASSAAPVNENVVEEFRDNNIDLCKDYDPKDVFNFDETALFYKAQPNKSLTLRGEKCLGGKSSKMRLTVGLLVSATGEKQPPIIIGKAKRPRSFKRLDVESLFKRKWRFNKTSWMTAALFQEYGLKFDEKMRQQNRKVLLFLDNATCHPDLQLRNVKLMFLPPNTTSP